MKVIHIFYHSESPYYPQNWKFTLFSSKGTEWHVKLAEQILKRTRKYQVECWHPERKLRRVVTGEKDGIIYRAFPSLRLGFGRIGVEESIPLLKALKERAKNEELLIHLHGIHGLLPFSIAYLLKDTPIVGTHLGDPPFGYLLNSNNILRKLGSFPLAVLEPRMLKGVDRIFAGTRKEYDVLSKYHSGVEFFHAIGVDFEKYKPMNRQEARSMLNLRSNKEVMLFVGRFRPSKGVDVILDAYREMKGRYDVQLVLVGGEKGDSLFKKAVDSGAIVVERKSSEQLIPYYSAADVYLLPIFDNDILPFKGFGIAPIESLACGMPIVGTNLMHFMGDEAELKAVGKIPKSPDDVVNCVSAIFEDPASYANCREVARKYYDWDVIVDKILNTYKELEQRYYGKT